MKVKSKIRLGLFFLLIIIILLAGAGSYYINYLANESKDILRENYNSLVYTKNMIHALDDGAHDKTIVNFETNLIKQENNITEKGERQATENLRNIFLQYKTANRSDSLAAVLRGEILNIQELNMNAITAKNSVITQRTKNAYAYITILGTLCFLLSFTFVINFPRWIADPIVALTEGIRKISVKDYATRIQLNSNDEFGELAQAFNNMAEDLNRWEHSNVSKLLLEKSRIEAIINNMQDAVIGLDENRRVLFINEVAETLLTLKKEEVIGKYAPDMAMQNDLLRNLLNKAGADELKIYANNKESYFVKNIREVTSGEKVIGEVIALHNITPFKELDTAKTNFIATVSHELKTPIASIRMCVDLLKNEKVGGLNTEQKQLVNSIDDDTTRLLKITSELLNLSQIETGKIQLNFKYVTPKHIIELAVNAVHSLAEQKYVALKVNIPDNLPYVKADLDKTVWVVVNFLTNAIYYSNENTEVLVAVKEESSKLVFLVQDFGKGIDRKYHARIFERYFQIPGSKKTGTGLGLAICKEFIEAQQGEVSLTSELGKGSIFSFTLNKS